MALVATKMGSERHILKHRHLGIHLHMLKRTGDTDSGDLPCTSSVCAVSEERHRSADRRQRTGHQIKQRAFSGPVGTDQSDDLASANLKANIIDRNQTAERSSNSVDLKYRLTNPRPGPMIQKALVSNPWNALRLGLSPRVAD